MSPPSFSDLIDQYQSWGIATKNLSRATVAMYVRSLKMFLAWLADPPDDPLQAPASAAVGFHDATLADLERFTGLYLHSLGMAARTRRPFVSGLRSFYRWAEHAHGIHNTAAELYPPNVGAPLPIPLSADQIEKLLQQPDIRTFKGLRDLTIMLVLAGAGIRLAGLINLHEEDIITAENEGITRWILRVREKGDKERLVPLPAEPQQLLQAYMTHDDLRSKDRVSEKTGKTILFVNLWSTAIPKHEYFGERVRLGRTSVRRMLKRYAKQACLKITAHPHAWRHYYGTELAENDVDVNFRSALLGHVDPRTTQIYDHLAMRKLTEKVDQANPLKRIRAPVLDGIRQLSRAGRNS